MSGFLRPEVARGLRRWQEVLAGLAVIALGIWITFYPGPIIRGFGYVMAIGGALALIPAFRRARFASSQAGRGPGVVRVDEGRILYLGPVTGGTVALAEMTGLSLRRDGQGHAEWVLTEPGALLTIPVNAAGADALFDAFTSLPGLSAEKVLAALRAEEEGSTRLWSRSSALPLTR